MGNGEVNILYNSQNCKSDEGDAVGGGEGDLICVCVCGGGGIGLHLFCLSVV